MGWDWLIQRLQRAGPSCQDFLYYDVRNICGFSEATEILVVFVIAASVT